VSRNLLLSLISLCVFFQSFAQDTDFKLITKARQDSIRQARNFRISGMGGPGYTPELKLILGGNLLMTFSANFADTTLQRSSIITELAVGIEGAVIFNNEGNIFLKNDRFRVHYLIRVKYMPDNYFGVGYESAMNVPKGPNTTAYHKNWFQVTPEFLFKAVHNLYAGVLVDINQTLCTDVNPLMQQDPYYSSFGPNNFNAGFGVIGQYDSRDNVVNAYKGLYARIVALDYSSVFGSENNYQVLDFDYRQFKELKRPRHVFAWQIKSRVGMGNVPYAELSMVGSPYDLRGYLWGRFRERTMLMGIVEYRHMFNPINLKRQQNFWSKHGLVTWVGAGFMGHGINDWNLQEIIPNIGLGYRFELLPRMNVRFDAGFGLDGSTGFYLKMTEAF